MDTLTMLAILLAAFTGIAGIGVRYGYEKSNRDWIEAQHPKPRVPKEEMRDGD